MTLEETIRAVVANRESEYDDEGGAWLASPNPDESYLRVDALTEALAKTLRSFGMVRE